MLCLKFARLFLLLLSMVLAIGGPATVAHAHEFNPQELGTKLSVGYAVRVLDVNADGKQDIAIVDSRRVLWLENPSWNEHVVYETPDAKFDNVCFAAHDVNGDGRIDFALGADWQFGNSDSGGTIGWLEQTSEGPWIYRKIASEPTTHRMQWADLTGDGRASLVVAPLKGRGTRGPGFDQVGVRLLAFTPGADPAKETWSRRVLTDELHVMHGLQVADLNQDEREDLLTASYEGVTWLQAGASGMQLKRLGTGQEQPAPKRGASEVRQGRLADGQLYLATIEPWHGDKVVVYIAPHDWQTSSELWTRFVLDEQLAWGHAVVCANLDDDPEEELVVGVRDDLSSEHRSGVRIYDPVNPIEGAWSRELLDAGGVAVEDLTVADLDNDGDMDIVAVGRATHNVKVYWNQLRREQSEP
ncbi:FG-GAP repeat domain-containing protein [Aureliella helgolandensis]|uniref:FG-GAP repeat protein n=1 Tax=Aureliella helgolandensis TaxID=2527968 RepID=A0A518GH64_9BACT|nr:VCBS repeat-containing protein [Aureliella helgolandensis]QDV27929.1 FG-GAP repeat protein [Aureliella helgolandensis]